ncbi:fused MFS/spermidine synthase [Pseudonocardia petroleophila]|uniref:Fused MFS/spermidine synthase n=1 Tax=Pseudonocardia petroleophila TaxID=37331 RepID=A0A7G7MDU7_9PSEU|nr:fused MFS/spermidine synthase [Pseudonocardia petroleophila]QNG50958.1 fused MFS/spermidine synthase [Pseudonocardia petroleophila]
MSDARAVVRAEVDHGSAELVGDPDRPQGWTLLVDGTAQSHVDLDDPTHLEFEYVRRLAHVVDLIAAPTAPLRVLHLGGGAWTLPRYVAATRPGSTQQVAEIDGGLVDLVGSRLPVDGHGIEVTVGDARAVLSGVATGSVDLLVLDVFAGARTPAHLTSAEFVADAARVLAPGGVYAANVADGGALPFARTQFAAAGARFAELAVVVAPAVLQGRRFGNLVLVASDGGLPVAGLVRRAAGDPFPARVLDDAHVRELATTAVGDRGAVPSPMPPSGFFGRP